MNIAIKYHHDDYLEQQLKMIEGKYPELNMTYHFDGNSINLENVDVVIASYISKEELEKANQLKVIIFPYTGVNHLPLKEMKDKNITILNSHAHAPIVALRAFTLGLSLLGRVVELHNQLTDGKWLGINDSSTWTSILNMRCGMIGMGEIGINIVDYLKPFHTPIVTLKRYEKKCQEIDSVSYFDTIAEVCENSDIIFVSLPLTKETENIIDEKILSRMKDKYIVNVGRGALIKEEDLYLALKNKTLKGAALDVWYQYPKGRSNPTNPSKFPFHSLDNVLLSPHCAGNSSSTKKIVVDEMIRQLESCITNQEIENKVDLTKEY